MVNYHPVVAYTDAQGLVKEFECTIGTNPPLYHVGDEVTVTFVPDKDETARLDEEQNFRVDNLLKIISLLMFGISGLLMLIFVRFLITDYY